MKLLGLSVEGVGDALPPVPVEPVIAEEVTEDALAVSRHLAFVQAARGIARESGGGSLRGLRIDQQDGRTRGGAWEHIQKDSRPRDAIKDFGCANEPQQSLRIFRPRGRADRLALQP